MTPDAVSHDALIDAIRSTPNPLLRSVQLFDLYKPAGEAAGAQRSMAVQLELRDDEATLTDERIDAALAQILEHVGSRLGVRLRS